MFEIISTPAVLCKTKKQNQSFVYTKPLIFSDKCFFSTVTLNVFREVH